MFFPSDVLCCCALRRLNATREQSPGEPHRHPAHRRLNSQPVRQQRGRVHVSVPPTLHQPPSLLTQPTALCHCLLSPLRAWKLTLLETRRNPVRLLCSYASSVVSQCLCAPTWSLNSGRCSPMTRMTTPTRQFPWAGIRRSTSHPESDQVCQEALGLGLW